jgi:hypothetical protein
MLWVARLHCKQWQQGVLGAFLANLKYVQW